MVLLLPQPDADDVHNVLAARLVLLSESGCLQFFLHTAIALGTWLALMFTGYALNPAGVPQWMITLLASFTVPLLVGVAVNRFARTKWP